MIWSVLIVVGIIICGMWGGQQQKWVRRYLVPLLASSYVAMMDKKKKWKACFYLLLIGILSVGYGETSKLRKFLGGSDFWTRIAYGLFISVPFLFFGKWWACIALPVVRSIRAGGFKITKTKDFLWEDFMLYGTIGLLVVI